jgi:hypothetical protein
MRALLSGPRASKIVRRLLTIGGDSDKVRLLLPNPDIYGPWKLATSGAVCFSRGYGSDRSPNFDSQITRQNQLLRDSRQL